MNKIKLPDYKIILIVLVTIVWGSTFVVIKDIVHEINAFFMVFIRCTMAALAMFVYAVFKNKKALFEKRNILYGLFLGFLLGGIYSSQVIGLKFTSSGHSAFITGIAVVLVPLFLFLFWKQKFKSFELLAIGVVLVGLFLLTYEPGAPVNKGDIITLSTAIIAAFHFILAGKYVIKTHPLSLITWQFIGGAVISLICFINFDNNWEMTSNKATYYLLYLGFIGTLFCYFVYVWAQQYVSPMLIVLIFSLEPVFASIFGYYFLTEIMNNKELLGASTIILGLVFYQVRSNFLKQKKPIPVQLAE